MMKGKRFLSGLIALSMLAALAPSALAENDATEGNSYFDFEASDYSVSEDSGELKIKVKRHGGNISEAEVTFKAADFLSAYGVDYDIIDENGDPLEKISGEKPDVSEFVFDDGTQNEEPEAPADAPAEEAEAETADSTDNTQLSDEDETTAETVSPEEGAVEGAVDGIDDTQIPEGEAAGDSSYGGEFTENELKKSHSTGSSLLDAQAAYLDLPVDDGGSAEADVARETLEDMYSYFLTAEGAQGVLRFESGETEKEITVRIYDNDAAENDKIFMMALMGTDTDDATIAANATTYVTISDNEEYETPLFELDASSLTLSRTAPEGYVTVRRTGGEQYFSMVYLSTVKGTAAEGSYEGFEGKTVAFIPGETEKQVKLTAYDFSASGTFGVRLEGTETAEIGNYYTEVTIEGDAPEPAKQEPEIELMAANVAVGSAVTPSAGTLNVGGGWKTVKTGSDDDNRANVYSDRIYLAQYDKGKYSGASTNNKIDLTGMTSIIFDMQVGGDGNKFHTRFGMDRNQTNKYANQAGCTINGKISRGTQTVDVSDTNGGYYLKFNVEPYSGGKHNPRGNLYGVQFRWARYTFLPQNSAEAFNRKLYDFSEGAPQISDIYYDGETTRVYNPGTVTIRRGNDTVSSFYANNTEAVTISDANYGKNAAKGIYLKGVYFTSDDMVPQDLYDGISYTNNNVYYVAANSAHNVVITPNQSFLSTLISKGVVSQKSEDCSIKIYPVYSQERVKVNFEQSDYADLSDRRYDADHLYSHFANILEACDAGNVTKNVYRGVGYYTAYVPKGSVVRVKTVPVSDRAPSGVCWWYHNGTGGGTAYYAEGARAFSGSDPNGRVIEQTDYTMADIVANSNMSMLPTTGDQTFYVGYSPLSYGYITGVTSSLEGAVMDITEGFSGMMSASDGSMTLADPYIGKNYIISAYAPDNHYTSWANMSGDTNNNGIIGDSGDDDMTARIDRAKSKNPTYVYGSRLNISLDQDNTRYYYEFLPKTNQATVTQRGSVVREKTTLYKLARNEAAADYEPVSGVYMDIAGFTGMTDANGNYEIAMNGLPSWGTISASLTVGDQRYNAVASIESSTRMVLPALEKFTARSVSAAYRTERDSVSNSFITIKDDELRLTATVTGGETVYPTAARFYIYNDEGYQTIDCNSDDKYTTAFASAGGNDYTASLTFNPKKDMAFGYKVYVQFCDQNGSWGTPIDMGYSFYAPLDLGSFIFPMIGSSTLEDAVTTGFVADLIGDPLGDIDVGSISGFDVSGSSYTPAGVAEQDREAYTWPRTSYSYGFSTTLGSGSKSWDSEADYNRQMQEYTTALENGTLTDMKEPQASKYNTRGSFQWSVTPSVGFNLTLSSRNNGDTCFEDLLFYVKIDFNVSANQEIALPIGISILISGGLSGDVSGVYYMYTNYQDSYETEGTVPYTAEDFGLFKDLGDRVRREAYVFVNPRIAIGLGLKVLVFSINGGANFDFDMDFRFTTAQEYAYGDVDISLDWSISIIGFDVYSNEFFTTNQELFRSNADEHFTVGTSGPENANSFALMEANDILSGFGDSPIIMDEPVSRDYLENRSEWHGSSVQLMSTDDMPNTAESTLREGAAGSAYTSIVKINDSEMLMIFVDDDTSRSDVNKRAVFYSIGDGSTWSEPQLVDNDGTLDDYPYVYDLGDRLLVAWSSAENVLEDGATVEDALKSLNIKVSFFDKASRSFGEITQLTKTTDEDYTADVLPRAAYDSETDRLILYYTKTEYTDLDSQTISELSDAVSVTAYMFYEDGSWTNETSYTDEELSGMTDAERENYRLNWYGQRFLDLRLDSESPDMLRVVDTDAISYNGLALFTWTADWDRDLDTTDDRDVFLQIYNFSENSFTHLIRVTPESGTYSLPKLGRSGNNCTYLFYGAQEPDQDHGEIRYLDVTNIISEEKYTLVTNGTNEYYTLTTESEAKQIEEDDGTVTEVEAETVTAQADTAAQTDNISDYDVYVDSNGQLYLFWTDMVDSSREIFAAMYNGTDVGNNEEEDDPEPETDYASYWSEPVVITDGGEDIFYSGIDASVIDGTVYISSGKGVYGDDASTSLVMVQHVPYSEPVVNEVTLSDDSPQPGSVIEVTASVKNEGILTEYGAVKVTFEMNGEVIGECEIEDMAGGSSEELSVYAKLPDDNADAEFTAYVDKEKAVSAKTEQKSELLMNNGAVTRIESEDHGDGMQTVFTAALENAGNINSDSIVLTAYSGDTEIGTAELDALEPAGFADIEMTLNIPDSAYELKEGMSAAPVRVDLVSGGETLMSYEGTAEKPFDTETVSLLDSVTGITFENDGKYTLSIDEESQIQPVISGVENDTLKVNWLISSDGNVVNIDYSNTIIPTGAGTAVITGIVVPYEDTITFDEYGNAVVTDWEQTIPEDELITVTAEITVEEPEETPAPTRRPGGGGGGGIPLTTPSPTATAEPAASEVPATSETPAPQQNGDSVPSMFDDIAGHWASEYIERLAEAGMVNGTGERIFEPNSSVTRAQFARMLMNTGLVDSGSIEVPTFTDVEPGAWYYDAVQWAVSCGVAEGMGDGTFEPESLITREQMAAMANRFASLANITAESSETVSFTDADEIAEWAMDDVETLVSLGIINGRDTGKFDPKANMTRAESTVVICNILDAKEE